MDASFLSGLLPAAIIGYLLGSIPFGLIFTRSAGLGDIRNVGSGNIGATNVLRTGNKALAAATLAGDIGKGLAAVALGWWLLKLSEAGADAPLQKAFLQAPHAAGFGAFVGHVFPVWLGFKGGKGVATYIGIAAGLLWPLGLVFCGVWLAAALLWRYSSLSALIAACVTPLAALGLGAIATGVLLIVLSLILVYKHDGNIRRLIAGKEPRIGASKSR